MHRALEQLPLTQSIQETAARWPDMTTTQQLGACAANLLTVAGPVARYVIEQHQGDAPTPTLPQLAAHGAIDLRDVLDGELARRTGGTTPLGKELDPFADKADFGIQEWWEYSRGNLSPIHLSLRFARDVAVTGLRAHVMAISDGKANVGAGRHGQISTALRQISNRITAAALDRHYPGFRRTHQTAATGGLLLSGVINVRQLLNERAKYA